MSRISFGGYGEPIPLEAMPDVNDDNALTLVLPDGYIFNKDDFIALGYTHYEVMCVGAAGGKGGNSDFAWFDPNNGSSFKTSGGAGGGGGLEVVSGNLEDLPDACAVVVGTPGADGANGVYSYGAYGGADGHGALDRGDPGSDGGASTFGGTICRASGGKGGGAPPGNNYLEPRSANDALRYVFPGPTGTKFVDIRAGGDGGRGGLGGTTVAGGGGLGGRSLPGSWSPYPNNRDNGPQTLIEPENGAWDGHIGEGGGGGRGGTYATFMQFILYGV